MANWNARLTELLNNTEGAQDLWKHCGPVSNDIWTALRTEINDQSARAWLDQRIALTRLSESGVDEIVRAIRRASEHPSEGGLKPVSDECRKVADQLSGNDDVLANSLPILITVAYIDLAAMRAASSPGAEIQKRVEDYRTRVKNAYQAWCRWRLLTIVVGDWTEGILFRETHATTHDNIAGHHREWWFGSNSIERYLRPLADLAKRRFFNDSQRVAMQYVALSFDWNKFASAEPEDYTVPAEIGQIRFGPWSLYLEHDSVSKSEPHPRKLDMDDPGIIEDIDLAHGKLISYLQANYKSSGTEPIAGKSIGKQSAGFETYTPSGPITKVETKWNRGARALGGIRFWCGKKSSVPYGNSDNASGETETAEFDDFHLCCIGGEPVSSSIVALELGFRHDSLRK